AMDQAVLVQHAEALGDLLEDRDHLVQVERAPAIEPLFERAAADEGLRSPGEPVVVTGGDHRDHVWMVDALGDLRLALETLEEDLVGGHILPDHLERDGLSIGADGLVDTTHSALAELGVDRVRTDRVARYRF